MLAGLVVGLLAAAVLGVDNYSKAWAVAHSGMRLQIVPGVLSTLYTTNTGAIFGLFRGSAMGLALAGIIIVAAVLVFWWLEGRRSLLLSVAVGFLLGGALGNMGDRIREGSVVDFLHLDFLPWWPSFNVADVATLIGVVLVVIWMLGHLGRRGAT